MLLPKGLILLEALILLLTRAKSQQISSPSVLLPPKNFNHHQFQPVKFLKNLKAAEPTKQGPVLFPNDAPPPPRPPLIVTSRPVTESIGWSDLNNTIIPQSQAQGFLARVKDYKPFVPTPSFNYNVLPTRTPYSTEKNRIDQIPEMDNTYIDYGEQPVLPPIFKILEAHANQNALRSKENKTKFNFRINRPKYINDDAVVDTHASYNHLNQPMFNNKIYNNDVNDDNSISADFEQISRSNFNKKNPHNEINDDIIADFDNNKNYAFSYSVKDHKSGDDFSHSQHSIGSATNGEYRVRLPDGRMQIVSYTADENGYKADVRYDENKHAENNIEHDYVNSFSPKPYAFDDYRDEKAGKNDIDDYPHHYVPKSHQQQVYPNVNYAFNSNIDFANQNTDYNIDRSNNNNKHKEKIKPVEEKDDYFYPDNTKEDYIDYSSEYSNQPYVSKFSVFAPTKAPARATVTVNYERIKELLVNKNAYKTEQNYDNVDLNIPSSTQLPYEGTTEHVVVITKPPNLYTNTRNILSLRPVPDLKNVLNPVTSYNANVTPRGIVASTPKSYLVSTIANLKNKINLSTKPILSDTYVDKINKYLTFN